MVFPQNRGTNTSFVWHEDGTADVTAVSGMTGKTNTVKMCLKKEDYERWAKGGGLIQNDLPHLTPDEREFLMTGTTAAEWDYIFKDDQDVD